MLTDLKRYPEALSEIAVAFMYEPNDINVLSMQAETFLNLGDYHKAKKIAETLLKHDSKDEFALEILETIETKTRKINGNTNITNNPVKTEPPPINKKSSIFDLIRRF